VGSYICIRAAREPQPATSSLSAASPAPPSARLSLSLSLSLSLFLRYKYLALCIISIELSGLSIRPKLLGNPNRRRLHGRRPCTFRVQRPPRRPRDKLAAAGSSRLRRVDLSDHSFAISFMNSYWIRVGSYKRVSANRINGSNSG